MFNQYRFIAEEHRVALHGVVQRHGLTPTKLANLYETAALVLASPDATKLAMSTKTAFSKLSTDTHEIAVVTCIETGVFVQLAKEKAKTKVYITVGQKWAMEQPSVNSSINTVLW